MNRTLRIEISKDALIHNLNKIRSYSPNKSIIAMVKANAYGFGIDNIWPILEGRVEIFGVASIEEALYLRNSGSKTPCLLMQGVVEHQDFIVALNNDFHCMLHTKEQLKWLSEIKLEKVINIWVKIDTGMHRLGFDYKDLPRILTNLESIRNVKIAGIITHMACADDKEHPKNQEQITKFYNAIKDYRQYPISIANSATIINFPNLDADFVRPGLLMYGASVIANTIAKDLGFLPVMSLKANIMSIHHYKKGEDIGYGATFKFLQDSIVAVLPIGYGDGYPRHIATSTPVFINGNIAPIIGRVSMDMLTIDITHIKGVNIGDTVELWGNNLAIETIAHSAGSIAYEIMCQISTRIKRILI